MINLGNEEDEAAAAVAAGGAGGSGGGGWIEYKDRKCNAYANGSCTRGDACKFSHDGITPATVNLDALEPPYEVYVKYLPPTCTEDEVYAHFIGCGAIEGEAVRLMRDEHGTRSSSTRIIFVCLRSAIGMHDVAGIESRPGSIPARPSSIPASHTCDPIACL
jgi:hypothetical protein